ncbi:MAG: hypothetical protein HC786_31790, partial [Richelia sp. CSU_2_1]|nr:hypothetical protein [Richelia sp. CSU_2_1]
GRRKKEEGRRKREEGRGKNKEGRIKREEGRKTTVNCQLSTVNYLTIHRQSTQSPPLHSSKSLRIGEDSLTLQFGNRRFNFHFYQSRSTDKNCLIV